jgi:hypothetical protein
MNAPPDPQVSTIPRDRNYRFCYFGDSTTYDAGYSLNNQVGLSGADLGAFLGLDKTQVSKFEGETRGISVRECRSSPRPCG